MQRGVNVEEGGGGEREREKKSCFIARVHLSLADVTCCLQAVTTRIINVGLSQKIQVRVHRVRKNPLLDISLALCSK